MTRLELNSMLQSILGSDEVHFQPPTGMKLKYPCCIYKLNTITPIRADNTVYKSNDQYTVTFIHKDADVTYKKEMFEAFSMIRFDRRFVSDNLYHDVYILYT